MRCNPGEVEGERGEGVKAGGGEARGEESAHLLRWSTSRPAARSKSMISPLNCRGWWKVSEGTIAADDMVMVAMGRRRAGGTGRDFIKLRAPWKAR